MRSDTDIERRLVAAAESIPVELPPADAAIRGGRRRGTRRIIALAAAVALVGTGTTWAVTQLGGLDPGPQPADTFDPGGVRYVQLPTGRPVPVPEGWFVQSGVWPGIEDMALSTSRDAVEAAISGCGLADSSCSTRHIEAGDVETGDAFVQVAVLTNGCTPGYCDMAFPDQLRPDDFDQVGSIDGEPVLQAVRTINARSGSVEVRYWVGPDATQASRDAAEYVVANLRFTTGSEPLAFDPNEAHPVDVWYADAPVPVPDGWASTTVPLQLHFGLGLGASTNADAVAQLVEGCGQGDSHCSIRGFREGNLSPTDAFVYVSLTYRPSCASCSPPSQLPPDIVPGAFEVVGEILGSPLHRLTGQGPADAAIYGIEYWVGPEADAATRDATEYLVSHLNVPTSSALGLVEYSDPDDGYTITYPAGWYLADEKLTPILTSPAEILALGTYVLRPGGTNCAHVPENAIEDLFPQDALIWLAEDSPGKAFERGFEPRPETFATEKPNQEVEARYCLSDPEKRYTQWWIPFADAGRAFYLYVAMGPDVSPEVRDQVWAAVDSLEFEPAAE